MSFSANSLMRVCSSTLTAGVLALTLACSGTSAHSQKSGPGDGLSAPAALDAPAPAAASTASSAGAAGTPVAAPPEPPSASAAMPSASAPAVRKSPMQALNQMVTAQALLVSLLLAPLSKDALDQPLAQVDAASTPPTR